MCAKGISEQTKPPLACLHGGKVLLRRSRAIVFLRLRLNKQSCLPPWLCASMCCECRVIGD